ncbi:MAG: ABC transporter permease, partial [Firmicutes bacterium]|nr:ABC transporter permease [Bacillota bacterium]
RAFLVWGFLGVAVFFPAAQRRGSFVDVAINVLAAGGISIPVYVFGLLFVLVFAVELRWLPANGYVPLREAPLGHFTYLVLPVVTLSLTQWAQIVRITRSTVLEVQGQDYVRTARAKGISERRIAWIHVLRNALIPVITIIGLQMGRSFGSIVLVESVFNWPGLSTLLLSSVTRRDLPVVQGTLLFIGILIVVINFVTDLIYAAVDPRIRYD